MHRRRMSVWLTKNSSVRSARGWGRLLMWLGALCVLVHPLWADVNGRFLGTVSDPSGAAVPRAKVSLRNPETGLVRETVTDEAGSYEFLAVPVGDDYIIEVEATGFRKAAQSGLRLLVNQPFRAHFELQVGDVVQTLNVVGAPVQVETTNTQLGDVIEDRKMTGLPLNGRSCLDLLGLQAGVVPINNTNGAQPVQPVSGDLPGGQLSVNGQRENANAFMVNGASVEETGYNGAAIVPVLDSIQEFRLLTNSFDPEFGHFSGAVVNVITKAGTNELHGTGFEFLRNDKLDARNFFDRNLIDPATGNELPGTARGVLQRNQFGWAAGGPLIKNRLFFFSDYQGTRESHGISSGNALVPTLLERGGNFSDVGVTGFKALTGIVRGDNNPAEGAMPSVLSARLGYTVTSGEPYWVPGCTTLANAQAGMCVFPNQVIPQSAFSPAAVKTLALIPTPVGATNGQPFFSTSAQKRRVRDDKWGLRFDLNSKRIGDWSFYYHFDDALVVNPFGASATPLGTFVNIPGFASQNPSRAQNFTMSNTKVFGPTTVNEVRLSYVRVAYPGQFPIGGLGKVSQFGFMEGGLGLIPANPKIEGVPQISLGQLGTNFGSAITDGTFQNNFQVQDGLSKIVRAHTFKFGGTFTYHQWNRRGGPLPNGAFVFLGSETGNDFADFLLGAPDIFIQSSRQFLDARAKSGAAYVQDSYRVRSNFTVNYGVRWEFSQPWYDTQNKIQAFVPGQQSTIFPDSPLGWLFPGDKGVPRTLAPTRYNNFAPRLGLAYSPAPSNEFLRKILGGPGKTSLRAAVGIFYTTIDTTSGNFETGDAPFGFYYVSPSLVYFDLPYKSRTSGADPGQRFPFIPPPLGGGPISFAPFLPIALSPAFEGNIALPYAEDFNLTVQRELGQSTILTVGYVGTRGHSLFSMIEFNAGNAAKCLAIRQLFINANRLGSACGPFGEDTVYTINNQAFYGTRPYSVTSGRHLNIGELDFGDNPYESTLANSNYNALQVTLDKRVGAVRFLGAYTWSKSLDNSSGFVELINPYNPKLSKSLSGFDLTHNFVFSYSYDLPFARWHASHGGAVYKLISGWQVNGITRFTTGVPVTLQESDDRSLCGCDGQGLGSLNLPNWTGQPIQFSNPRTSGLQYFSTNQFFPMTLGVPGNANLFDVPEFDVLKNNALTFGGDYDRNDKTFWKGTHPRGLRWAFLNWEFPGLLNAVHVDGKINDNSVPDKGWTVELAFPWKGMKYLAQGRSLPPKDRDVWRIFFGRFELLRPGGVELSPHPAWVWSPHRVYDTHVPECFPYIHISNY